MLVLTALLVSSCCSHSSLSVKHQYIDEQYLASSHVQTPDLRPCWGFCGQQLIIGWRVPFCYMQYPDLHLHLVLRLRNQQIQELSVPMQTRHGQYVYKLMNDEYWATNGILTYMVEIRSGDIVLETWKHQIWTQLIQCQAS